MINYIIKWKPTIVEVTQVLKYKMFSFMINYLIISLKPVLYRTHTFVGGDSNPCMLGKNYTNNIILVSNHSFIPICIFWRVKFLYSTSNPGAYLLDLVVLTHLVSNLFFYVIDWCSILKTLLRTTSADTVITFLKLVRPTWQDAWSAPSLLMDARQKRARSILVQ